MTHSENLTSRFKNREPHTSCAVGLQITSLRGNGSKEKDKKAGINQKEFFIILFRCLACFQIKYLHRGKISRSGPVRVWLNRLQRAEPDCP